MKIALNGFNGARLTQHPLLIPETNGVDSRNQKPGRADFRPWREPQDVRGVPPGTQTIYRMPRDLVSDSNYWLTWPSVVHAMHGFISEDTVERTFYTGDGTPKQTDQVLALASAPYPTAWRELGVPSPIGAPTLAVSTPGVSTTTDLRYYVYTYITSRGEESAPSAISIALTCQSDATVLIDSLSPAPSGAYDIDRIRIYRTQSGQTGAAEFFFLREVSIGTVSSTDDGRELGEVMPTDGWLVPDPTMSYLTPMWNGMAAGIVNGAVRYCVAFKPYAWPMSYETLPPDAKAVALGRFGQALLVLTTAKPLLVAGSSPDSLDEQPLEFGQSCIAPRGVVSFGHGVAWPCPDGLAYIGTSGPKMLTAGLMTRDDWQAINPASIVASIYEGAYMGSYTVGGVTKAFLVDPIAADGIYFLEDGHDAYYFDELQDSLFVLDHQTIRKWDAGSALMTATFVSKTWRTPPTNFSAGRVVADAFPVTVKVFADGTLVHTQTVTDRKPFRLPGGFTAIDWKIEIRTQNPVQQVLLASSISELAAL